MKARDKLKKNNAQQKKQVLATLQQGGEDHEEKHQYDDWPDEWPEVYHGQGDEYNDYGEYYEGKELEDEEDEESDDIEGEDEHVLDVGIEDHINNNMETTNFEIAHKEELTNKKSRNFYDNHQSHHCFEYGLFS